MTTLDLPASFGTLQSCAISGTLQSLRDRLTREISVSRGSARCVRCLALGQGHNCSQRAQQDAQPAKVTQPTQPAALPRIAASSSTPSQPDLSPNGPAPDHPPLPIPGLTADGTTRPRPILPNGSAAPVHFLNALRSPQRGRPHAGRSSPPALALRRMSLGARWSRVSSVCSRHREQSVSSPSTWRIAGHRPSSPVRTPSHGVTIFMNVSASIP